MKKVIKKAIKPLVKPLLNRFNKINEDIADLKHFVNEEKILSNIYDNRKVLDYVNEVRQNEINNISNVFYYHGGSGNHGCEALLRTLCDINDFKRNDCVVYSYTAKEDHDYGICDIISSIHSSTLDTKELQGLQFKKGTIAYSIGGDNYCGYDYGTKKLALYNKYFNDNGAVTALIGCSIEPEVLDHQEVLDDLEQFSLIVARESLTYNALVKNGINKNTELIPDSAFTLKSVEKQLPSNFIEGKTIGINLSDLVQSYDNLAYNNYKELINYILSETDFNVALIPHVVQSFNDDMKILTRLYKEFNSSNRMVLIENTNCMELKGYIKRCCIFVGARTHATIAAYSSCIPTLVLGYSIKSKGIATDIFGTYENYVLPVQDLKSETDLLKSFKWILNNKDKIRAHLEEFMPGYIDKCYLLKEEISKLRKNLSCQKLLAPSNSCTGCGACANICPVDAINMIENEFGFLAPVINYEKCIHCNKCKLNCPVNHDNVSGITIDAYAARSKDDSVVKKGSSGGIFYELAKDIISKKGIVYGAALVGHEVNHIRVEKAKDIELCLGSKYLQSKISYAYRNVKKDLKSNKAVLFSGTPCQIAGLYSYLGESYCNLFTVEVICHGVPSPLVYRKYIESLEKKYNSKVSSVEFRNKSNGWVDFMICISFVDGKVEYINHNDDMFMKLFLSNVSLRESCYSCSFKNFRSNSDITLGDYWGVENVHLEDCFLDDLGTSLLLVNTGKGRNLIQDISRKIILVKTNLEKACEYNSALLKSVEKSADANELMNDIEIIFK